MTPLNRPTPPRRAASPSPTNLVLSLPAGVEHVPAPAQTAPPQVPAPRFDAALDRKRIRRANALFELQFALQMTWGVLMLVAALLPLLLLIAWGVEVFLALRVGGRHTTFALAGFAVLLLLGTVATAVERFKNYRAATHLHVHHHHHRGRW